MGANWPKAEFDPVAYEDAIGELMSHWTRDAMRDFPQSRIESELAVFIAGMPRSGTSLLDQVIDAHGEAAGDPRLGAARLWTSRACLPASPPASPHASPASPRSPSGSRLKKGSADAVPMRLPKKTPAALIHSGTWRFRSFTTNWLS